LPDKNITPAASKNASAVGDLPQAITSLQGRNARLRGLRVEVGGGVVYFRGSVGSWEDLLVMARAVSQLPGVERVVLDNVQTVPR
jgi:hypothetical protein